MNKGDTVLCVTYVEVLPCSWWSIDVYRKVDTLLSSEQPTRLSLTMSFSVKISLCSKKCTSIYAPLMKYIPPYLCESEETGDEERVEHELYIVSSVLSLREVKHWCIVTSQH